MTYIKSLPLTPSQAKELTKLGYYLKFMGIVSKAKSMFMIYTKGDK